MSQGKLYKLDEKWECTKCKTMHPFGGYVAAHWREELIHTCDCGQKHSIQMGYVTPTK